MRMKRIAVFLVVILLTSICTAGVALANTQNSDKTWRSPKYGGTLTLVTVDEPTTMDTLQVTTGMYDHMYISEPPIMVTPEGNYERAGWLKSFSMSPDEKTWTFQIKKGVKFHDGTKLDAEALAWILKKRKKDKDIYSTPLWTVPAENITVIDKYTLQLKQTKSNPNLYASFSSPVWLGGMRTPNAVERYGKDYGSAEAYGNGPFKFVEWVKGDYMKLTRNEDYDWAPTFINHQGPPYLKNVIIKYVSEKTTQIQMLKAGKADALLDVPPMYADQLKKNEDINVSTIPTTNLYTVEYNVENDPMDDLKLRKALNYAINRKKIAEQLFYGYASPAYSLYAPKWLETPDTKHLYKYDADRSKSLLESAGWKDTDGDGIREKNGKDLKITMVTQGSMKKTGAVLQAMWKRIGVKVDLRIYDPTTLTTDLQSLNYDAYLTYHGWGFRDLYYWWFDPSTKGYPNVDNYDSKKLRELVKKNKHATTRESWINTTDKLVNYHYENVATICALVRPQWIVAADENVKNFQPRLGGSGNYYPYLNDTYLLDVYKKNLKEMSK